MNPLCFIFISIAAVLAPYQHDAGSALGVIVGALCGALSTVLELKAELKESFPELVEGIKRELSESFRRKSDLARDFIQKARTLEDAKFYAGLFLKSDE